MKQPLLFALVVALAAPNTFAQVVATQVAAPIQLEVGQSHTFRVNSRNKYNAAGVRLEAGAHYTFCAVGTWTDLNIDCRANGWTDKDVRPILRPMFRAFESKRRCPSANWFELIGTVGCNDCQQFRIGCRGNGWTYTPKLSGPLYSYANDLPSKYGNNSGCITVTITRIAAPAKCRLPSCCR